MAAAIDIVMSAALRELDEHDQALMSTRFEIMNRVPALRSKLSAQRAVWASEIAQALIERRHFKGGG